MTLWIAPMLLQFAIGAVMLGQRLIVEFPIFFAYTMFVPSRDIVLLFTQRNLSLYSWIYWSGEAAAVFLGLAVIYEVLTHVVRPYPFLRELAFRVLQVAALVGIVAAAFILVWGSYFWQPQALTDSIYLLERSLRFVQVCLLLALALFMSRFGLTWNDYVVGILAGFGVAAGFDMVLLELRGHLHCIGDSLFGWLNPLTYDCAVIIWAVYFLRRSGERNTLEVVPTNDLAQWDDMVRDFWRKR